MRPTRCERVAAPGFTLVELMIVVVIVAILALAAVPLYMANIKTSRMSEGMTGVGMIRMSLRIYASGNGGRYPVIAGERGDNLGVLNIVPADLSGKYFSPTDYVVTSAASHYAVRATLPEDPNFWYEVDEAGNETKSYF